MTTTTTDTAAGLRAWARGSYPDQAAVEMLIRAFGGRFARAGHPWICATDDGLGYWLEGDDIPGNIGALSSGEQRFLRLVAGLCGGGPVDLTNVCGLDREHAALVLAGIAHANGSHEQSVPVFNDEHTAIMRMDRPGSLYPWPEETS